MATPQVAPPPLEPPLPRLPPLLQPPEDPHRGPPPGLTTDSPPSPFPLNDSSDTKCHPRSRSERDVDFDRHVLHRGVRDAGRWAYGTILVEAWVWNDRGTHLVRPPGGWWLDPIFHAQQHSMLSARDGGQPQEEQLHSGIHANPSCPFCRLTDPSLPTFEPPQPLTLGEGIPGVLWDELQNHNVDRRMSIRSLPQAQRQLVWRQVQAIVDDPDQPFNPRLQLLGQRLVTKIGWAAAVSFDIQGSRGLVVYYARAGVSKERLSYPTNEEYLVSAAYLIGAAYALRKPRQACITLRRKELDKTMERVRRKIRLLGKEALWKKTHSTGSSGKVQPLEVEQPTEPLDQLEAQTIATTSSKSCRDHPSVQWLESHAIRFLYKLGGGGVQPPPAFNWTQTIWTFIGVLGTLVLLTYSNTRIVGLHGSDHAIVLGPFGALMTLMFGLTGAPASQPRNALIGQTISISIAIGISKLDSLEPWMQQSLATALAVTCMVKLGVTHPPAGAAALLFANGRFGWYNLLSVLLGNLVAIATATLINDINPERQYPTFWGAQHYYEMAQNHFIPPQAVAPEKEELVKEWSGNKGKQT